MKFLKRIYVGFLTVLIISNSPVLGDNPSSQICGLVSSSGTVATGPLVPIIGTNKALIIYVQFSDDTFGSNPPTPDDGSRCTTDPNTEWPYDRGDIPSWGFNMIDESSTSTHTQNSLTDYFCKMSRDRDDGVHGKFHLIGLVYPELIIPDHPRSWYQNLSNHGFANEWIAVNREILTKVDNNPQGIDLSSFDDYTNGTTARVPDGILDMVILAFRFHFGGTNLGNVNPFDDLEFSGISNLDGISNNATTNFGTLSVGGLDVNGSFEEGSGIIMDAVDSKSSTILAAHEYGHRIFGRSIATSSGDFHFSNVGAFGLMDGSDGSASMSAYERERTGWISPQVVNGDLTDLVLNEAITTADIYKILIPGGEYFLLENRQRTFWADVYQGDGDDGCDGMLPGTGLMIAHINPNSNFFNSQLWWERANGGSPTLFGTGSDTDPYSQNKFAFGMKNSLLDLCRRGLLISCLCSYFSLSKRR